VTRTVQALSLLGNLRPFFVSADSLPSISMLLLSLYLLVVLVKMTDSLHCERQSQTPLIYQVFEAAKYFKALRAERGTDGTSLAAPAVAPRPAGRCSLPYPFKCKIDRLPRPGTLLRLQLRLIQWDE
jgi:hypothetical protein